MLALAFDIGELVKSISVLPWPVVLRLTALITPCAPGSAGEHRSPIRGVARHWFKTELRRERLVSIEGALLNATAAEVADRDLVQDFPAVHAAVTVTPAELVAWVLDVLTAVSANESPHRTRPTLL